MKIVIKDDGGAYFSQKIYAAFAIAGVKKSFNKFIGTEKKEEYIFNIEDITLTIKKDKIEIIFECNSALNAIDMAFIILTASESIILHDVKYDVVLGEQSYKKMPFLLSIAKEVSEMLREKIEIYKTEQPINDNIELIEDKIRDLENDKI
jgi:hypothetical protein